MAGHRYRSALRPGLASVIPRDLRLALAHLEIESISPAKEPLPMTETGYRSWFGAPADVESDGGPAEFVRLWLQHEARADSWKAAQAERRQHTLFCSASP